jgi:hypothetical protein
MPVAYGATDSEETIPSTQEVIMEALIIPGFLVAVFLGLFGLIMGINNPN